VLKGQELAAFKKQMRQIKQQVASLPKTSTKIASR